jgi:thiol-disulfide isomerase/thioredoxin
MKKLIRLLAAPALAGSIALASLPTHAVELGQAAPDIELPGASVPRLSSLLGKVVYVDFWASWCGPCKQSFPWMNEMQKKYATKGLTVLAINLDAKRGDADNFLAQNPALFALAFDPKGESARRVGVKAMPTSVLVGADGKVLYIHRGFSKEERGELEAHVAAALAQSTPIVSQK